VRELALLIVVGIPAVMTLAYAVESGLLYLLMWLDSHIATVTQAQADAHTTAARQADDDYWEALLDATESDTDRAVAQFRAELDRSGL
jgi:hypothetical protein